MVLKLLVVFSLLLSHVDGYRTDCVFHSYSGGPGEVIAKFQPTLPGKISLEFGNASLKIFSSILGLIPEVGGARSALYGIVGTLTDNSVSNMRALEKAINDLIDDVRKTVEDLKNYVDAKFDEFDYDKKSEALNGIYDQSGLCAAFNIAVDKKSCLTSLVLDMVGEYPTFLPTDPKYETFEQLLPLTRQFSDLHFAVLLDTVNITKLDPDYKMALANFSIVAYNYFVHGINSIVDQHLKNIQGISCDTVGERQGCVPFCYTSPCPCYCLHIGAFACQQQWDNGDGCRRQFPVPADSGNENNCYTSPWVWPFKARKAVTDQLTPYKTTLETAIRKYWLADVGQTMGHWKELGLKAGASNSSFLPYSAAPTLSNDDTGGYNGIHVARILDQHIKIMQNAIAIKGTL